MRYIYRLLILILFIAPKFIYANKIDSLKIELSKCTDNEQKAYLYNNIADAYLSFDIKKAKIYADSAYFFAKKTKNYLYTSNALINIGNTFYYKGDLDSTLEYYIKSYNEILKSKNQNEIAASLNRLGLIYESKSNYEKASEYFLKAIKIFDENKNKKGIADVYNNLGIINDRFSFFEKSIKHYRKSLKIYKEIKNKIGAANVLNNIASIYSQNNKTDTALIYLNKSVKILAELNSLPQIATAYNNIGDIFLRRNNYDSAFFYMNKSLNINKKLESKTGIGESYYEIAHIFINKKQYKKALDYLSKSLAIRKETGNLLNEFKTLHSISNTYKYKRNYKEALNYYEQYTKLKDSVYTEKMQYTISELQIKYDTDKKEKEIQLLIKDAKIKQSFNIFLIVVVLALFIISALFFYAFRTKSILLIKNKILHEQQEEMSVLELEKHLAQKKLLSKEVTKQHDINKLQEEKYKIELDYKNRELTTATMLLLNKNKILSAIQKSLKEIREHPKMDFKIESQKLINEINSNINLDSDWEQFKLHFEKVNPNFFIKLKQNHHKVTSNDLRLCAYIKINLSSKEIAQMLNITLSGVNKRLYRLRKKIEVQKGTSLKRFLSDL